MIMKLFLNLVRTIIGLFFIGIALYLFWVIILVVFS